MESETSELGPTKGLDQNELSERRQIKLTAKALVLKIEGLQKDRQAKVNKLKGVMKVMKELMQIQSGNNVLSVQSHLKNVHALFNDATKLHNVVIPMLPEEEQEKQNAWFTSVHNHYVACVENVEKWLSDVIGQAGQVENSEQNDPLVSSKPHLLDAVGDNKTPHATESAQNDVTKNIPNDVTENIQNGAGLTEDDVGNIDVTLNATLGVDDDIRPNDSISNAPRASQKRSSTGTNQTRTTGSSTRSSRIKVEAEMAALIARQRMLKDKHALEEEEAEQEELLRRKKEQLRQRKEQLDLNIEIAASEAKLNVLRDSGGSHASGAGRSEANGMNSYLEEGITQVGKLNWNAETFVPVAAAEQPSWHGAEEQYSHLLDARPKVKVSYPKETLSSQLPEIDPRAMLASQPPPLKPSAALHPRSALSRQPPSWEPSTVTHTRSALPRQPPVLGHAMELHPQATQLSQLQPKSLHHKIQNHQAYPQFQAEPSQPAPSIQIRADSDPLLSVLYKQNEITSMLVEQQSLSSLPKREIQIFDGDPIQFQTFIRAFEYNIEQRTRSAKDCLYFLEQHTRGQPRELVRGCEHMCHEEGYVKAKSLLQEHFGNPLKIASAYMEKAFTWPALKGEDVKALRAYSIFLRQCCNALGGVHFSHELDAPTNMQMVVRKLPYKLKERWREVACNVQERSNRRAVFQDIVEFVERQVKIASDPLFGDLNDIPTTGKKDAKHAKSQPYLKARGSSFATTVTPMEKGTRHEEKTADGAKRKFSPAGKNCLFCGAGHGLDLCLLFDGRSHSEKMSFMKEKRVCYGCLCIGHRSKDCKNRLFCKVCNLRHPSMLHIRSKGTETGSVQSSVQANKKGAKPVGDGALISVQTSGLTGVGERDCTLSILPVQVKSAKGSETVITYAFLDPGSSASFCTEGLMNRLNLTGRKTGILLRTMGQEKVVGSHIVTDLEVAGLGTDCFCKLPEIFTQKSMPVHQGNIPRQEDLLKWPHLRGVKISGIDSEVDLLIGTNVPRALEPWEVVRSADGGPYAVKTMLGWTVNGPLRGDCITDSASGEQRVCVNRISVATLEELWRQQTKADFPECVQDEHQGLSREDCHFMKSVTESAELADGHYSIGLPLRRSNVKMPNNRNVAVQRTLSLKRRFMKDRSFHADYTNFMSDVISKGYAERVLDEDLDRCDGRVWYIPHHGVYHPQKKKLRVVFDCAATFQGTSLNAQLLQGPDLTSSLVGVISRFRKEPVVLMADTTAMFHQVRVPSSDSDLLRFLWWPKGDYSQDLVEYKMVVHLFGATSSPSCASFALRKCAEDNQTHFSQRAVDTVLHNFYVDDCLVSVATEEEAVSLYHELCALCAKGGFQLTKWSSNCRNVLAAIPQAERSLEVKDLDLDNDALPVERALGVQWCVQSDSFKFKVKPKDRPLTRRGILSVTSSIYDPLGFLSPVVLAAKRILQSLCRSQLGWDDALPVAVAQEWTAWLEELHQLEKFKVERCFKSPDFGEVSSSQLHHFADASEEGYGTVTYLLQYNIKGQAHCAFVMGKSRVAPLKSVTIPRMELTAAVVASRMDKLWKRELQMPLRESVFWTDSTSVLKYINNQTSRFKVFVANRVAEILTLSSSSQWRYVNTSSNPADLASRGAKVNTFLRAKAWVLGPAFLIEPEVKWPVNIDISGKLSSEDPEIKAAVSVNAIQVEEADSLMRFISHFSSWTRLKRMVGWLLRFKRLLLRLGQKRTQLKETLAQSGLDGEQLGMRLQEEMQNIKAQVAGGLLSVEEFDEAERAIIRFCQMKSFPDEIARLRKGENVKKTSCLYRLDPILDDGVLRVGGRLGRAAMPEEAKHPALLAKDLHISTLVLRHIHQATGHSGRNYMLSQFRQRYWIPGACMAIRKILSRCVVCRKLNAAPGNQRMADLPLDRVSPDEPPFTRTGVDCFGPFGIKRGRCIIKRYGVIFTCLAVRAVHLEVLSSLDTDSFVHALRRFVARRGQVLELRSDNGTNFVGAERELREAIGSWNHMQISNELLRKNINWIFNPPTGSHHGGVWERLIRSVRRVLNSILKTQNLDEEGLQTVFCEVEAIINGRPITKASTDQNDLEALTPNHLLLLKSKPSLPPGVFQKEDVYARRRWRQVQYMSDLFWRRWVREYLPLLQERQKWQSTKRNFVPGDLVIILDDSAPRNSWLTGRVTEADQDKKGHVRRIRIMTKTGFLDRPITKVCLLQEAEDP